MAKSVLTEASAVNCGPVPPHGAISMTGVARLIVDNQRVLTTESVSQGKLSACSNPTSSGGKCTEVSMTDGASTRLKVDGVFVVLDSVEGTATPKGTLTVDKANNDRLKAD